MNLSNLLNIFNRKLPKGKVVWCIGIPYTKDTFLACCRKDEKSDYIESLELRYSTTDEEELWLRYKPVADKIVKAIRTLAKYGVDIVDLCSLEDLENTFSYPSIIVTAHRHRYLDCLDFMGNTVKISAVVDSLPENFKGILDISSCYSSTFLKQCKHKALYGTYIAAATEVSIALRLFIYEHTIRYMCSHREVDYLDAFHKTIARIISIEEKKDSKRDDVFLGGGEVPDTMSERNASVFAPNEIVRGETMLVQVYIYKKTDIDNIISEAKRVDEDLSERGRMPVKLDLKNKDCIDVTLNVFNLPSLSQTKSLIWNDRTAKVGFFITVPENYKNKKLFISALISQNKAIVGEFDFSVNIVKDYSQDRKISEVISRQFNKVFISYSHIDEEKVKFLAQGYKALGINYFFDRHYLKAGDVYPLEIQKFIESADLFILCWSGNASKSEYVEKELSQALSLAFPQIKPKENAHLTIHPIVLDPDVELPGNMRGVYNFEIV